MRLTHLQVMAIQLVAASGAPLAHADESFPVFHGEMTQLRQTLSQVSRARVVEGHVWTYGTTAIIVQLYPTPMDLRVEDLPPGTVPWRPAWVDGAYLSEPKETKAAVEQATFVLILREQDGVTCVVNPLTGRRILKERPREQDATAAEGPCATIWSKEGMSGTPEAIQREIQEYLRTPPAPPTFERSNSRRRK